MKNSIIICWGALVIILCITIFGIGIYEEKNKEVLEVKRTFIDSAKKYMKEEDKKPTKDKNLLITYTDLNELGYIGEVKYQDKLCGGTITVEKIVVFYKYNTNIVCE